MKLDVNTPKTKEVKPKKKPKTKSEPEKPDTRPFRTIQKSIKNIYNTVVIVQGPQSGKKYRFEIGQSLSVDKQQSEPSNEPYAYSIDPRDYHHLLSLKRNPGPGCCSGTAARDRYYFEAI